jgi:pimeloyl-ACP methyl ester carboxylesterase
MVLERDFQPSLDVTYRCQLADLANGDEELVRPFDNWSLADLPLQNGETVPYVRTGSGSKPIISVPGFTEGILNKAPLAVDLARRGHEVIVCGQNRTQVQRNAEGKIDVTLSQAENVLAILRAEGLDTEPGSVDIMAHSYGALVFGTMHKLAETRKLPCFQGSTVVLLDPAGTIHYESLPRLGWGFVRNIVSETKSQKAFPDPTGFAFKAGVGYALANKSRTVREIWEISCRRIDYERLLHSDIGKLAIVSFAESSVFPAKSQRKTIERLFDLPEPTVSLGWTVPISHERSGKGATHNDDQFNPSRVGGAIAQLL